MSITIDNLPQVSTIDPPDLIVVHNIATDRTKGITYQNLLNEITVDLNAVTQGQLNTAIANVTSAFQAADLVVKQTVFHIGCRISVTSGPFLNTNPSAVLGFGTWIEEQGNYYRGYTPAPINGVVQGVDSTYGSSEHNHNGTSGDTILNTNQMPEHFHSYKDTFLCEDNFVSPGILGDLEGYEQRTLGGLSHAGLGTNGFDYDNDRFFYKVRQTQPSGGTQGHNHTIPWSQHLPPTKVERVWRRVA